jgi:hypothetical protein
MIWYCPWHFTLFIPFKVFKNFHSLSTSCIYDHSCHLYNQIALFPLLLLICMIYTLICILSTRTTYLHPFDLYHMFAIIKLLFYNGKKKIDRNCHTKHLGIYDWIYVNFKHTRRWMHDWVIHFCYKMNNSSWVPFIQMHMMINVSLYLLFGNWI